MKSGTLMPTGDLVTFATISSVRAVNFQRDEEKPGRFVLLLQSVDGLYSYKFESLESAEEYRDKIIAEWAAWDSSGSVTSGWTTTVGEEP